VRDVPRKTAEEKQEIVRGIISDRYFFSSYIRNPEDIRMVFMVIGFGGLDGVDVHQIGVVYEEWDKAGPRTVNGMPIFMSCQLIHKDDWSEIVDLYEKAKAAIDSALEENKS
jgi:hypothetical protein